MKMQSNYNKYCVFHISLSHAICLQPFYSMTLPKVSNLYNEGLWGYSVLSDPIEFRFWVHTNDILCKLQLEMTRNKYYQPKSM